MGCQYCGKEIGPLRLLRDDEFCSSAHRKKYRERLSKALGQAEVSEFRAKGIAGSLPLLHPIPGSEKHIGAFVRHTAPVDLEPKPPALTVSIRPVRTALPKTLEPHEPGAPRRATTAAAPLSWLPGRLRAFLPEIPGAAPSAAGGLYPAPLDGVRHVVAGGRVAANLAALGGGLPFSVEPAPGAFIRCENWKVLGAAHAAAMELKTSLAADGLLPRTSPLFLEMPAGDRWLAGRSALPVRAGFAAREPHGPIASPSSLRQAQQNREDHVPAPDSPYLMCNRWMSMAPSEAAMAKVAVRADLTASAPRSSKAGPPRPPEVRRSWEARVCERWLDLMAAAAIPPAAAGADLIPVAADLRAAGPTWAPEFGGPQEFGTGAEWLELAAAPAAPALAGAIAEVAAVTSAAAPAAAWLEVTLGASVEFPQRSDEIAPAARWLELVAAPAAPARAGVVAEIAAVTNTSKEPLATAAWLEVTPAASVEFRQGADAVAPAAQWLELAAAPAAPARAGVIAEIAAVRNVASAPLPATAWLGATPAASVEFPRRSDEIGPAARWLELAATPAAPTPAGGVADFAAHAGVPSAPRLPGNYQTWNAKLLPAAQRKWLELAPSPATSGSFAPRVDLRPQAPPGKMPEFSWLPEAGKPRQAAVRDLWQPLGARGAAPASQGAIADLAPGISKVLVLPVPVQAGETGLRACHALWTEAAAASPSLLRNVVASLKPFPAAPQAPAQSLAIPEPTLRTIAGWRRSASAEIALVNVFASAQKAPEAWPAALGLPETLPPLIGQSAGEEPPEEAGHIPLEFYCQRIASGPARVAEWSLRAHAPAGPAFNIEAALGNLDDLKRKGAAPIYFFPKRSAQKKFNNHIIELIAAGFLLAGIVWIGGRTAVKSSRMPDTKTDTAAVSQSGAETAAAPAAGRPGPIARLRRAIADRAVVEVSDSFQSDMSAWGHAKSWAPGWSRNPDGYVRTGQLALFEPTAKFTDYRMEFFGQIESKSIGWVVRARDKKNYYAMKFTVIAPGLRPVIAMVHYPVIGGKPGHRIETPLNVMVHNNTPYHIGVSVQGRHIFTSIEGQEVDRWADDTLASGGVGFFSDPGERARLYWMKVSKNADFLGRICAYISGNPAPGAAPVAEILPIGWNYGYRYFPATRYGN